jgi:transcription elongation factor Elf1
MSDSCYNAAMDRDSTDYYCPHCGKRWVTVEKGEGDYYVGPTHFCEFCGSRFAMPYLRDPEEIAAVKEVLRGQEMRRLAELTAAAASTCPRPAR